MLRNFNTTFLLKPSLVLNKYIVSSYHIKWSHSDSNVNKNVIHVHIKISNRILSLTTFKHNVIKGKQHVGNCENAYSHDKKSDV